MVTQSSSKSPDLAIAPFISVGDIAPDWGLVELGGNRLSIYNDAIAGHPVVIVLCPHYSDKNSAAIEAFISSSEAFSSAGALIFAVFPNEASAKRHKKMPFPALLDRQKQMAEMFNSRFTTIVLRNNHHIAGIFSDNSESYVADALNLVSTINAEMLTIDIDHNHPPVLLVPEVFSPDDCRRLMEIFRTRGQRFLDPQPAMDYLGTDYKMRIPEHMREDRIDHFFRQRHGRISQQPSQSGIA